MQEPKISKKREQRRPTSFHNLICAYNNQILPFSPVNSDLSLHKLPAKTRIPSTTNFRRCQGFRPPQTSGDVKDCDRGRHCERGE